MKKDILVFSLFTAITTLIFYKSFFNFFAQDDFILINHFSQNGLLMNLGNVFGTPTVTHWRPLHNLYFFIGGSLFGRNYFGYLLLTLLIHITSGFLIYKTMIRITKNAAAATGSAVFYLTSPVHFVSLYWISGGATLIGFTFFITSFYFFLSKKFALSIGLFIASLLASEAMVIGAGVILAWGFLEKMKFNINKPVIVTSIVAIIFAFIQIIFFSPRAAVDAYKIEISPNVTSTFKYYLLRIPGFVEGSGLNMLSGVLALWLLIIGAFIASELMKKTKRRILIFASFVILFGLFPFILIPNHLSPHYMNVSLWGAAILAGIAFCRMKRPTFGILLTAIVLINLLGIMEIGNTNWVIQRSNLAKTYLTKIKTDNPPFGTTLIFSDNKVSTSLDAYYALGTGQAINFWFKNHNYKTCFTFYENCFKN